MTAKPKGAYTKRVNTIVEEIEYETVLVKKSKRLQKEPIPVKSKDPLQKDIGAKRGKLGGPKRIGLALSVE